MNSNFARVVAGIAVVVVAVVLFAVLRDDGESGSEKVDETTTTARTTTTNKPNTNADAGPKITTIVIKNGQPVGGIAELTYDKGERVRFEVDSDVSEEIHVHGYDLTKEVAAGSSVSFDFPATIEGIFEAELEGLGVQILELTVNP